MTGEEIRRALKNGGRVYGTMLSLCRNPRWAGVIADTGIDYVIIDTEHAAFSRSEVADMCFVFNRCGIAPIVRIPIPSSHYVTMAIDGGAQGVLAPYCENVTQVKEVISAARLRPLKGILSEMAVDIGEFPSDLTKQYLNNINRNNIVMIGIESSPALMNLEEILGLGNIDVIFIGPNDLSISMGIPDQYTNPEFESALERVIAICNGYNVATAIHLHDIELCSKWIKRGMRFVLYSSDVRIMRSGLSESFSKLRDVT